MEEPSSCLATPLEVMMRQIRSIFFCAAILSVCLLSSCLDDFNFGAGLNDWTFDQLPGNYEVWRINGRTIRLVEASETGGAYTVVDSYVSEIAYTSDYIFAQQVSVPEDNRTPIDTSNPVYFILSATDGVLDGPYSQEEFTSAYEALGLEEDLDWIKSTKLRDLVDQ